MKTIFKKTSKVNMIQKILLPRKVQRFSLPSIGGKITFGFLEVLGSIQAADDPK